MKKLFLDSLIVLANNLIMLFIHFLTVISGNIALLLFVVMSPWYQFTAVAVMVAILFYVIGYGLYFYLLRRCLIYRNPIQISLSGILVVLFNVILWKYASDYQIGTPEDWIPYNSANILLWMILFNVSNKNIHLIAPIIYLSFPMLSRWIFAKLNRKRILQ